MWMRGSGTFSRAIIELRELIAMRYGTSVDPGWKDQLCKGDDRSRQLGIRMDDWRVTISLSDLSGVGRGKPDCS